MSRLTLKLRTTRGDIRLVKTRYLVRLAGATTENQNKKPGKTSENGYFFDSRKHFYLLIERNLKSDKRRDPIPHSGLLDADVNCWKCAITADGRTEAHETDLHAVADNRTSAVSTAAVTK